jgi:dihydrofolate synthase/folylpolyglutamate synthase
MINNILSSHLQQMNLMQWLSYLEKIHPQEIDLGLSRIQQVAERLTIDFSFAKVITVAGTNGKGTTCAFLENALLDSGYSVAVYSSPHIHRFNERLRINKQDIDDQALITAFEQIESVRESVSLSYYEYTTLAAFLILMTIRPNIIILEVGLGGRLDATNIIDTDIAVLTTIDIDHVGFLGNSREQIGYEKSGIMRANKPVVIGDKNPPQSVLRQVTNITAKSYCRDNSFRVEINENSWNWCQQLPDENREFTELTLPFIPLDNVATALMVLQCLTIDLSPCKINHWIDLTKVPGRMEQFTQDKQADVILDVAHNAQAARFLAEQLRSKKYRNITAVFAMMADKDITQVLSPFAGIIDKWYIGALPMDRAASTKQLSEQLSGYQYAYNCFDNVTDAYKMAQANSQEDDLIVVFGSFFTVAEIRPLLM